MCGRYSQTLSLAELARRYSAEAPKQLELKPRYNLAPSQEAPVVVHGEDGRRSIELMRWGLVPGWAKDVKIGYKMINARAETAAEKPGFRSAMKARRCLVPACWFFEWRADPATKAKLPLRIGRKDARPFSMAGLWERWKTPEGKELKTFTILTTAANALIAQVHDRMPVILDEGTEAAWLAAPVVPAPLGPESLAYRPVSAIVNSPKNDVPACLEPLDEER